ncbi:hypothetical protein [Salibacter halophilus]|jgi:hypothetical protein|uniref:DUF2116 family Zn-ribbon domain-containing protein n=1 Tax=Salibacter halophilus TaxID=1803916 RepID=A0A6N6M4B1_9FLAO|nr:hypothetical protein [Salibacter halophilus]KAB1064299.1 hypothetical protein F3059_06250 [Salibacter halophilus]
MSERACLECGEKLRGRIDKRFCDADCRSSYHNRKHRDEDAYYRKINKKLKKNRCILNDLNDGGKTKISKLKLLQNGFNFNYFTHILRTKKGGIYFFCYDQGYIELDENMFLLVENKSED